MESTGAPPGSIDSSGVYHPLETDLTRPSGVNGVVTADLNQNSQPNTGGGLIWVSRRQCKIRGALPPL